LSLPSAYHDRRRQILLNRLELRLQPVQSHAQVRVLAVFEQPRGALLRRGAQLGRERIQVRRAARHVVEEAR
jgi:hypothetical protein